MIKVAWSELKNYADSGSFPIQYLVDKDDNYHIFCVNGTFQLKCIIAKESPASSDQSDFETNYKPNANKNVSQTPTAFAYKDNFFFRGTGKKFNCPAGQTTQIKLENTYAKAKFNGCSIMYGQDGDTCDLKVLDSTTGTYTTVPNYLLNQFGFDWNITSQPMRETLPYDADIFLGMQLVVEYTNNGNSDVEVAVNFYLHEDKS